MAIGTGSSANGGNGVGSQNAGNGGIALNGGIANGAYGGTSGNGNAGNGGIALNGGIANGASGTNAGSGGVTIGPGPCETVFRVLIMEMEIAEVSHLMVVIHTKDVLMQ